MLFISARKSPSYVMKPAKVEVVDTNMGKQVFNSASVLAQFEATHSPFYCEALNSKDHKAHGKLESAAASKKMNVDEEVLIAFLREHPRYGLDFVGISPESGEQVIPEERHIVPSGEQGFYCKLCGKHIANSQGKFSHIQGNVHKENLEDTNKRATELLKAM